jgi:hypothetical protein
MYKGSSHEGGSQVQPVPVFTYFTFSPESPLEFAATGELR